MQCREEVEDLSSHISKTTWEEREMVMNEALNKDGHLTCQLPKGSGLTGA